MTNVASASIVLITGIRLMITMETVSSFSTSDVNHTQNTISATDKRYIRIAIILQLNQIRLVVGFKVFLMYPARIVGKRICTAVTVDSNIPHKINAQVEVVKDTVADLELRLGWLRLFGREVIFITNFIRQAIRQSYFFCAFLRILAGEGCDLVVGHIIK